MCRYHKPQNIICYVSSQNSKSIIDHLITFIHTSMVTCLFIIFLGCHAVAKGSEMCDRVQFSFNDQNNINNNLNFTKQSLEKNGKPVYYTIRKYANYQNVQTIIWWNQETNSWLSQTIINSLTPSSGNKITKTKIKISQTSNCCI